MTRVCFRELDGGYVFSCAGHAGYAGKGRDIVCAGISALCMALLSRMEALAAEGVADLRGCRVADGEVRLYVFPVHGSEDAHTLQNTLDTVRAGFLAVEREYPAYVDVVASG